MDAAQPQPDPAASSVAEAEGPAKVVRDQARTAWIMGLAAILLAMVAPCSTYLTLLAALPLGLLATTGARRVLADPDMDAAAQVYAQTAMVTGIASAAWAGFILVLGIGILLMYAGLIVMVVMGA